MVYRPLSLLDCLRFMRMRRGVEGAKVLWGLDESGRFGFPAWRICRAIVVVLHLVGGGWKIFGRPTASLLPKVLCERKIGVWRGQAGIGVVSQGHLAEQLFKLPISKGLELAS